MSLFDKFQPIAAVRAELAETGIDPFDVAIDEVLSATEARVNGRKTLLAGTNNYLGLTFEPSCVAAAREAVTTQGTGTTGSRMANGTYAGHTALERELSDCFDCRAGIVFSTGYTANLGMLATLTDREDVILLDADCHASIYDGCRLSGAEVIRFRHNDAGDLDKRLRRLGARAANALILTEGIYSMLGDRAPLADIAAVKNRYGSYLLVDEAHSLGVLGATGRGRAEEAGVAAEVDFIVGTFSKSLGATGGFCVSNHPELDLLRYASRPYVFTASPSPSVVASTRVALQILREQPALREQLWENAHFLYAGMGALGFKLGPEPSPIVAAKLDSREQATMLWSALLARGVYVNLVFPPATPDGSCLLRCSVSASHTNDQLQYILDVLADSCNAEMQTATATD